jgi:hypothetical protein
VTTWAVSTAFASGLRGLHGCRTGAIDFLLSPFPDGLPNIQGGLRL